MRKYIGLLGLFILGAILAPMSTQALTLTPPRMEFGVEPGGDLTSKVRLINESTETTTMYASTVNFTAKDETGNPFFLYDETGGLASWINISPGPYVMLAGERLDVPFSITVPVKTEPGGYYAGIFFSPTPPNVAPEAGGQVGVVAKLGTLVLLRVAGDVTVETKILEFHINNDQRFFTRLPVDFWYRLRNNGGVHLKPAGVVKIKNMLGITSARTTANPVDGAVLSNSVRRFMPLWQRTEQAEIEYRSAWQYFWAEVGAEFRNFGFGRYTASLEMSNVPGVELTPKVVFWVLPWRFLLVAIVGLLVILFILRGGLRKYNRFIIKRARLGQ